MDILRRTGNPYTSSEYILRDGEFHQRFLKDIQRSLTVPCRTSADIIVQFIGDAVLFISAVVVVTRNGESETSPTLKIYYTRDAEDDLATVVTEDESIIIDPSYDHINYACHALRKKIDGTPHVVWESPVDKKIRDLFVGCSNPADTSLKDLFVVWVKRNHFSKKDVERDIHRIAHSIYKYYKDEHNKKIVVDFAYSLIPLDQFPIEFKEIGGEYGSWYPSWYPGAVIKITNLVDHLRVLGVNIHFHVPKEYVFDVLYGMKMIDCVK